MQSRLWIALAAFLLVGADASPKAAVKEDAALLGTWKMVGLEVNGVVLKDSPAASGQWTVTAKKIECTDPKINAPVVFLYELDASKKPKEINLRLSEADNKPSEVEKADDEPAKGIYAVEGNRLSICVGKNGRPDDFTAKADSERFLYTFTLANEKK